MATAIEEEELKKTTLIRIVDDDEEVRTALSFMLACRGWKTESWGDAMAFLRAYTLNFPRKVHSRSETELT